MQEPSHAETFRPTFVQYKERKLNKGDLPNINPLRPNLNFARVHPSANLIQNGGVANCGPRQQQFAMVYSSR